MNTRSSFPPCFKFCRLNYQLGVYTDCTEKERKRAECAPLCKCSFLLTPSPTANCSICQSVTLVRLMLMSTPLQPLISLARKGLTANQLGSVPIVVARECRSNAKVIEFPTSTGCEWAVSGEQALDQHQSMCVHPVTSCFCRHRLLRHHRPQAAATAEPVQSSSLPLTLSTITHLNYVPLQFLAILQVLPFSLLMQL